MDVYKRENDGGRQVSLERQPSARKTRKQPRWGSKEEERRTKKQPP